MVFYAVCALAGLWIAALIGYPHWLAWRRARVRAQAFPSAWRRTLRTQWALWPRLPSDVQRQLQRHVQVFLSEKHFIGCAGLQVTDDMRLLIAAQACLLTLNRPTDYFARVRDILVYPGAFAAVRETVDEAGVHSDARQELSGESWQHGQVVLSWRDVRQGARVDDDGFNVVIHEFAHQLDSVNGHPRGAPAPAPGLGGHDQARWAAVFQDAYDALQRALRHDEPTLFDAYAAEDPAEFFAVACEVFFEQGARMAELEPALYQELRGYFQVDPALWQ